MPITVKLSSSWPPVPVATLLIVLLVVALAAAVTVGPLLLAYRAVRSLTPHLDQREGPAMAASTQEIVEENTLPSGSAEQAREAARVGASFTLAMRRRSHADLAKAELTARQDVAAAILAMDAAADVAGRHNLAEQLAVEMAKNTWAQALADLLRGEAS